MKKYLQTLLPVCLLAAAPLAMAEDDKDKAWSMTGNVALTTDYIFRGISQTNTDPALQGGFDFEHKSGFYAGVWGSNVEFGDEAHIEIDLYGGYKFKVGKMIEVDVGGIHYRYPGDRTTDKDGDPTTGDSNFEEVYAGATFSTKNIGNYNVKYSYAPDFYRSNESAYYLEFNWDLAFKNGIGVAAHVGHSNGDHFQPKGAPDTDYNDYKIAVSKEIKGFNFELALTDTSLSKKECGSDLCESRLVLTVSKSL